MSLIGFKQGGVISPILFCVYSDELLYRLKSSGFGCHMGNVPIPTISYTDDIALLAPTISSLKLLLYIVKSFGNEYSVNIKPNKSKLLVFGKSYTNNLNITFNYCNISSVLYADILDILLALILTMKT